MKKRILAIVLIFACFGAFTSCNRQIQSKDIYGFPEPTQQIKILSNYRQLRRLNTRLVLKIMIQKIFQ